MTTVTSLGFLRARKPTLSYLASGNDSPSATTWANQCYQRSDNMNDEYESVSHLTDYEHFEVLHNTEISAPNTLILGIRHPQVGERDFFIDLLFYHTRLHSYVIVELKTIDFEPEHAGKLNFYIKAVDEQLRQDGDQPTIGLLLCKERDRLVAEYALSDIHKPIGVSEYQITQLLPEELQSNLPSVEEIEAELGNELGEE